QLAEALDAHRFVESSAERRDRIREMLEEVRLDTSDAFLRRYPHQLSGGQQQRVAIAMAFACRPAVVVLDEPATGLDVTTQARGLRRVRDLARRYRTVAVYVSHDLAVVAELAERVAVMYAGELVELAPVHDSVTGAAHPYTRRLIGAVPDFKQKKVLLG